ncbi:MAG: 30S ribosomal protein S6 [Bacillota bacterium]
MKKYETMAVINPDLDDEATEAKVEKITSTIEDNTGEVVNVDKWGVKELAYEIEDFRSGCYVVVNFKGEPETLERLNRMYNIDDTVLRNIILRAE